MNPHALKNLLHLLVMLFVFSVVGVIATGWTIGYWASGGSWEFGLMGVAIVLATVYGVYLRTMAGIKTMLHDPFVRTAMGIGADLFTGAKTAKGRGQK